MFVTKKYFQNWVDENIGTINNPGSFSSLFWIKRKALQDQIDDLRKENIETRDLLFKLAEATGCSLKKIEAKTVFCNNSNKTKK